MIHRVPKALCIATALVVWCAIDSQAADVETDFARAFRQRVVALLEQLPPDAAARCTQPFDQRVRWEMQYTGGVRAGLPIRALDERNRAALDALIQSLLSSNGWAAAQAVARQDGPEGLGKYYFALFGDPRKGPFALRIAEHHLTLVHLELEGDEVKEFGPILLGSDPPVLWQPEEQAVLSLWSSMKGAAPSVVKGRGLASEPMAADLAEAVAVGKLPADARAAFDRVWQGRLDFFSPAVQARILRLIESRGGPDALRMAFYGEPALKRCTDGGRWDWKVAGDGLLMDFETSRKHIHMSLWIR